MLLDNITQCCRSDAVREPTARTEIEVPSCRPHHLRITANMGRKISMREDSMIWTSSGHRRAAAVSKINSFCLRCVYIEVFWSSNIGRGSEFYKSIRKVETKLSNLRDII